MIIKSHYHVYAIKQRMQQRPEYMWHGYASNSTRKIIKLFARGDSFHTYVLELNKRSNKYYLRSSGKQTG